MLEELAIRPFEERDEGAVVVLWERAELTRPWNDPRRDIARKATLQPELFLVGELGGRVVASVMGGYEGHRGWVNYLAVDPAVRRRGFGRSMMLELERRLRELGCPKINLAVRSENTAARAFYSRLGYFADASSLYGKRLEHDGPPPAALADPGAVLTLVVALHVDPARLDEFERFETRASRIMSRYGGRIERRLRFAETDPEAPHEVHLVTFPSAEAFSRYRADPELADLSELRARAVRRTTIWQGADAPLFAGAYEAPERAEDTR